MPVPASLYATVTCWLVLPVSVTTNARFAVPLLPSATLGELIESTGCSSLVIVPVPSSSVTPPASVAFEGEDSRSTTVSCRSKDRVPRHRHGHRLRRVPGRERQRPRRHRRVVRPPTSPCPSRRPCTPLSLAWLVLPVSVTTNARFAVPLLPSATLGELIESTGAASSSLIVPGRVQGCGHSAGEAWHSSRGGEPLAPPSRWRSSDRVPGDGHSHRLGSVAGGEGERARRDCGVVRSRGRRARLGGPRRPPSLPRLVPARQRHRELQIRRPAVALRHARRADREHRGRVVVVDRPGRVQGCGPRRSGWRWSRRRAASTTVSLASSAVSPVTLTVTVLEVSPAAKVSVPAVTAE